VVKVKKLNHKGSQSKLQRNTKEKINLNHFFNSPGSYLVYMEIILVEPGTVETAPLSF